MASPGVPESVREQFLEIERLINLLPGAVTVLDGTTINFTLNGQQITAETIDGAIDHDALLNTHNLTTDIDHNSVSNLTVGDVHTQYALLAGRSGGQTLIGGTASGNDLTLQSTSNATKGKILFGTSAYDEVNNRLGIGTTSPTAPLELNSGTSTAYIDLQGGSGGGANVSEVHFTRIGSGALAKLVVTREVANDQAYLAFYTKKTAVAIAERMRIDGDGNLIVASNAAHPNPGVTSNTTLFNFRGFSLSTDSATLSAGPSFGAGIAANRAGPLLGLKNSTGESINIEAGNVQLGNGILALHASIDGNYAGVYLGNNFSDNYYTQNNTSFPSWAIDIGGIDNISYSGTNDTFSVIRQAAGAAHTARTRPFSIASSGDATFSNNVRAAGLGIGTAASTGTIRVGASPSINSFLSQTNSVTNTTTYGIFSDLTTVASANSGNFWVGVTAQTNYASSFSLTRAASAAGGTSFAALNGVGGQTVVDGTAGSVVVASVTGVAFQNLIRSGATITDAIGATINSVRADVGAGTVTTATGLWVKRAGISGTGSLSLTTERAIYIEAPTIPSAANRYAIYSEGGIIYSAGNVGIGDTAPYNRFVAANTGVTAGNDSTYQGGFGTTAYSTKIGYDISNDIGVISASQDGVAWKNIALAPSGGNVGVKAITFGTSADGVLAIGNGTAPTTSPADMIQIYSVDLSAGNATLGLRTETAVATESVTSDRTLSVVINGTTYKILLKA